MLSANQAEEIQTIGFNKEQYSFSTEPIQTFMGVSNEGINYRLMNMYQINSANHDFPADGILGLAYSPNATWNYLYSIKDSLKEKVVSFSVGEVSSVQFGGTNSSLYNGTVSKFNRNQNFPDAWAFETNSVMYGTKAISYSTPVIIDTSQTFLLMPSAYY